MTAYEIIMVVVIIPVIAWMLKKLYDLAMVVSALQARMDGIQSFAQSMLDMSADIKNIYRIVDRRRSENPVPKERRKNA
jgi:hypothetical protein